MARCPNDAPQSEGSSSGEAPSSEAAELSEPGGQGRDRTADLAVFSRMPLIRNRPGWFG
jgi:hypothetical protein